MGYGPWDHERISLRVCLDCKKVRVRRYRRCLKCRRKRSKAKPQKPRRYSYVFWKQVAGESNSQPEES